MHCEKAQRMILEQTLEGALAPSPGLQDHLRDCPECRDLLVRVAEVDRALRALPLEQMPAWSVHQMLAQAAAAGRRRTPFWPWTLWLPVGSLLMGLLWAYITLIWSTGPEVIRSFDPRVTTWLIQLEEWVITQQVTLNVVFLSIGAGFLLTVLAVGLSLYAGRNRAIPQEGHSH